MNYTCQNLNNKGSFFTTAALILLQVTLRRERNPNWAARSQTKSKQISLAITNKLYSSNDGDIGKQCWSNGIDGNVLANINQITNIDLIYLEMSWQQLHNFDNRCLVRVETPKPETSLQKLILTTNEVIKGANL